MNFGFFFAISNAIFAIYAICINNFYVIYAKRNFCISIFAMFSIYEFQMYQNKYFNNKQKLLYY